MARIIIALLLFNSVVWAKDVGQWGNSDPEIRQWYQALMMPDVPTASCCGEADAYWCDEVFSRTEPDPATNGPKVNNYCKITDPRPDEPLRRPHKDIGTEVQIPDFKMKWGPTDPQPKISTNPTGHSIVFLSATGYVYCFVYNGGV